MKMPIMASALALLLAGCSATTTVECDAANDKTGDVCRPVKFTASGVWHGPATLENLSDPDQKAEGWTSAQYAPAWVEADLGSQRPLSGLKLVVNQFPDGVARHEIWVSNAPIGHTRADAQLAHVIEENITNWGKLNIEFKKRITARYVQIRTTHSPSWVAWWRVYIVPAM